MNVGRLEVELTLDSRGYSVGVKNAGAEAARLHRQFDQLKGGAKGIDDAMHRAGGSFRNAVITMGALRFAFMDINDILLAFPRSVAQVSGEFERLQTLMEGLSKSTDGVVQRMEGLRDFGATISLAKNAPFDMKALSESFVKFKSADMQPMTDGLNALVNAVAKAGGSSEQMKRASTAIQQMAGKGVISMEELRQQLGEAVPNAMALMARGMGLSMKELTSQVSKGTVEARTAMAKMFALMSLDSQGAAEKFMGTFPGALERLKTEFQLFQKEVGDQGFMTVVTQVTKQLAEFFASAEGKGFARSVGQGLRDVAEWVVVLGEGAVKSVDSLKTLGAVLLSLYGGAKLQKATGNIIGNFDQERQRVQQLKEAKAAAYQAENNEIRKVQAEHGRLHADMLKRAGDLEKAFKATSAGFEASARTARDTERKAMAERAGDLQRMRQEQAVLGQQLAAAQTRSNGGALLGGQKVVDTAEVENLRKRYVALGANAEALQLMNERSRGVILTTEKHVQAINAQRAAIGEQVNGYRQVAQAHVNHIGQLNQTIASNNMAADAALRAGSAFREFGKSLLLTGAYTAAFAAAAAIIVHLWDQIFGAAKRAKEEQLAAMRIQRGQGTQGDLEKKEKELAEIRQQLEARRTQITNLEGLRSRNVPQETNLQKYKAEVIDLEAKLKNIQGLRDRASVDVERATQESRAQEAFDRIKKDAEAAVAASNLAANFRVEDRKLAQLEADDAPKAAIEAQRKKVADFAKQNANLQIAALKEAAGGMDAVAAGLSAEGKRRLQDLVDDQLKGLVAQRKLVEGPNKTLAADKKGKDKAPPEDTFLKFLDKQAIDVAESKERLRANADGLFTYAELLESARAKIREMATGNDPQLQTLDVVTKKLRALDSQEMEKAAGALADKLQLDQASKVQDRFNAVLAQIEANKARMSEVLAGDEPDKQNKDVAAAEKVIAQFTRMRDQVEPLLAQTKMSWEEFVGALRKGSAVVDALSFGRTLIDQNKGMTASLISDDRERAAAQTAISVDSLQRMLAAKIRHATASGNLTQKEIDDLKAVHAAGVEQIALEWAKLDRAIETPIQKMARTWSDAMGSLRETSTGWLETFVNGLVDGNLKVGDFVKGVLADLAKIKMKEILSGQMGELEGAVSKVGGFLGMGGGRQAQDAAAAAAATATQQRAAADTAVVASAQLLNAAFTTLQSAAANAAIRLMTVGGGGGSDWAKIFAGGVDGYNADIGMYNFAKGGIMTGGGPKRLRSYRNGGIANSPQLAQFGEGDMAEAYVPLPDGRTIPVTMEGGSRGGGMPSVNVNVINQTGQPVTAQKSQPRMDGGQMVLDVVLKGASTPGPFRDGLKQFMGSN